MPKMRKIVVIGGGTGLSVLLQGIKNIEGAELTAIVSVADDGGSSGVLREDLGMLPPGDIRSCLLALASEEEGMREILAYRFSEGRLKGQNIGNLIIAALNEIYGSFDEAIEKVSDILKVKGRVLPVSGDRMVLCGELENGNIIVGESQIPKVSIRENSAIADIFLETKDARATKSAVNAIREADAILIGPGSLYTSIIPNFLVHGVTEALRKSGGIKIYICNVMTQPGETNGMSVACHTSEVCRFLSGALPDFVIANDRVLEGEDIKKYSVDGAAQVIASEEDETVLDSKGISLIKGAFIETRKGYVRHDSRAVAEVITRLMGER